jgi:toxin ParE1/3/4
VTRSVVYSPEAQDDLIRLYDYIAQHSGAMRALAYTERVMAYCMGFAEFPKRGARRDDLRPGLRVTGFERRITIAFHVSVDTVTIDRFLYGGRDVNAAFADDDDRDQV